MTIEDYYSNIAAAIREKGSTSALITPGDMPQAILDLPSGGGSDNPLSYIQPYKEDIAGGYIDGGTWYIYPSGTNLNTTLFEVKSNTQYIIMTGQHAERFRAMFTTTDISEAVGDVHGINIINNSSPSPYTLALYIPAEDGYIAIYTGDKINRSYCFEGSLP